MLSVSKLKSLWKESSVMELNWTEEFRGNMYESLSQAMRTKVEEGAFGWRTSDPETIFEETHRKMMGDLIYSRKIKGFFVDVKYEDGKEVEVARYMNPFQMLPNVKEFTIGEGFSDLLFAKFGIKKTVRLAPVYEEYTNKASNRYVEHQVRRLNMSRTSPDRFWTIGKQILRRSNTFLCVAINHVLNQ